jgi:prepilin-type N-terminal cleavage/methylation domain-containing protein
MQIKQKQSGFTLIEVLVVIAIGISVTLLVIQSSGKAKTGSNVLAETTNAGALSQGIRDQFSSSASFSGLTTELVVQAEIPVLNSINGDSISNIWGGSVEIASIDINDGSDNAGSLTYSAIPKADCNRFVAAAESGFVQITVGSTDVKTFGESLDQADLIQSCDNPANIVALVFQK